MNKFIKYPLIFIGVVATIAIVGFTALRVYWAMNSADEPLPEDSDLIPVLTEIPDEENAYFDIIKAQDALVWPTDETETSKLEKIIKGEEWDEKFIAELLERNKAALEHFEKASTYSKFRDIKIPLSADDLDYNTIFTNFSKIRQVAKLFSLKSYFLVKNGEEKEASDLLMIILKNGQFFQDSSTTINYLIGTAIKKIGIEKLRAFAPESSLKSTELMECKNNLEKYLDNENGLSTMWKGEYVSAKNSFESINRVIRGEATEKDLKLVEEVGGLSDFGSSMFGKKFKSNFLYKPNQTKRLLAEQTRILIENSNKNCDSFFIFEDDPVRSSVQKMFFEENAIGKTLANIIAVSLQSINNKKCSEDANIIEVQLMLVVKAYEQDKDKKPDRLEDLVPNYISEIPVDPFTGNPVEYSPEKGIIITKEAPSK